MIKKKKKTNIEHFRNFGYKIRSLISSKFSSNHIGGVLLKGNSEHAASLSIGLGVGLRTNKLTSLYKLKENNQE